MSQLQAFGLTLAFEVPVMLALAYTPSVLRVSLVAATASCLTHPLAWHIASVLSPAEYPLGVGLIEVGVVLVEAAWYWLWLKVNFLRALSWSALANAASFILGGIIFSW